MNHPLELLQLPERLALLGIMGETKCPMKPTYMVLRGAKGSLDLVSHYLDRHELLSLSTLKNTICGEFVKFLISMTVNVRYYYGINYIRHGGVSGEVFRVYKVRVKFCFFCG